MIDTFSVTIERRTAPHTHPVHEFIIGTEGTALLIANGESHTINNRQTLLVPAGTAHHYELPETSRPAKVTFVCFDARQSDGSFTPKLHSGFAQLLANGVSVAPQDKIGSRESAFLARMLKKAVGERDSYAREQAGSLLNTMLIRHLNGTEAHALATQSAHYEKVRRSLSLIEAQLAQDITIDSCARQAHMSRSTFTRYFRQYTNTSFTHYLSNARLKHAAALLLNNNLSVGEAAYKSGFGNLGHFYRKFQQLYGMTPRQYRKMAIEDA